MLKMKSQLVLTLVLLFNIFTQAGNIEPKQNLTILDGLSHNGVTSILEDSKGYIWIATFDGLNRYDGYGFKVFKNTVEKDLLLTNRIRAIKEDNNANIWIGTDEGLSVLNLETEQFKNIYSNKFNAAKNNGPVILNIIFDKNTEKTFCLTESNGILIFNTDLSLFKKIPAPINRNNVSVKFSNGIILNNTYLLLCTSVGLLQLNLKTNKYASILGNKIYNCNSLSQISKGIYICTTNKGASIFKIRENKNNFQYEYIKDEFKNEILNGSSIDSYGNLWLTTLRDGLKFIPNAKSLLTESPSKISTYMAKTGLLRMSCIFQSEKRGIWAGSFDKGIFRFNLNNNPFNFCHTDLNQQYGLEANEISSITVYDANRALISTITGKLSLLNTKSHQFEPLNLNFEAPASIYNLRSFFHDSRNNIWFKNIGKDGLYVLKSGEKTIKLAKSYCSLKQIDLNPRYATEDKYGNIWLATTNDVVKLNLNSNAEIISTESLNSNPLFKNNKLHLVRFVYADPAYDFIWVGTDYDGLIRINLKPNITLNSLRAEKFTNDKNDKHSISSDFVTSIVRLPNNEMWIGTERGGICKVINSNKKPQFICFSEKDGLSNNVVKRVVYDNEYNLWISTNIGLNKFNTKTNKFRNFRKQDGLAFEDFSFAGRMLPNGNIVLGGLNGLCYFDPKAISSNEHLPDLQFGEIKIFNKTIAPGDTLDGRVLYRKHLSNNDILELKYNEAIFSIELQSLHYSSPENHFIKYQLLPINTEWIEIPSNQRVINYSGLQPGHYKLKVMASNALNQWTEPLELKININPPFWKTWPAYIIYIVIVSGILYVLFFFIIRIYNLNHTLEIEKLEKDKIKEINAAKINVFANISHEIKTPLTLISGPLNLLSERFRGNSDISEKLNLVQRQSKKLALLVDQMHEFQMDDANQLKTNFSQFNFNDFIDDLILDFNYMAESENKKLEITTYNSEIFVLADKDKIEIIINNILNNAFKHTKANDKITISYHRTDQNLYIDVTDSGHGIDSDDIPHIFERFYQAKNKKNATVGGYGIGLTFSKRLIEMHNGSITVESKPNEGAKFSVCLPIIIDKLTDIEIAEINKTKKEFNKTLNSKYEISSIQHSTEFADSCIYIVEDNNEIRNYIEAVLTNFFKVKTFANGVECINALQDVWPDLILSDVQMPEMNGLELCNKVKTDIKTSHIPVVLLTAFDAVQDQIKGIKHGADAYLSKPFDVQHLVTQIEALLTNRKQLRERFQIDIPLTFSNESSLSIDNDFLEKLYKLMSENLDNQDLELDSFAKDLYLNRSYFYQKVKALTNQTPFELLKMYRLKKAAEMLANNASVNDVYMQTGFKSRTHFSKLFKEVYNISPGKYADQIAEKYKNA